MRVQDSQGIIYSTPYPDKSVINLSIGGDVEICYICSSELPRTECKHSPLGKKWGKNNFRLDPSFKRLDGIKYKI